MDCNQLVALQLGSSCGVVVVGQQISNILLSVERHLGLMVNQCVGGEGGHY